MAKDASCRSPTCSINFCHCRDRSITEPDSADKPPLTIGCAEAPKKSDGVAARLLNGVTAAFFSSLERCSCINIDTKDDVDDGDSLPLIPHDVRCTGSRVDGEHPMVEDKKDVIPSNSGDATPY